MRNALQKKRWFKLSLLPYLFKNKRSDLKATPYQYFSRRAEIDMYIVTKPDLQPFTQGFRLGTWQIEVDYRKTQFSELDKSWSQLDSFLAWISPISKLS